MKKKRVKDLLYPKLSYEIQGIAMTIRNQYGSGHKEKIYQRAFAEELGFRKIDFKQEPSIKIFSQRTGKCIGIYRPDFVVEDKIIIEIKALSFAPKKLVDQLYKYLENSNYELGYFINFGSSKLFIKRIIYSNKNKKFRVQ